MKKNIPVLILITLFISCTNSLKEINKYEEEDNSCNQVAEQYVSNLIFKSSLLSNRMADTEEKFPSFLSKLVVKNENDEILEFSKMSDIEQQSLYDSWKKLYTETLIEKLEDDPDLLRTIVLENKALEETKNCRVAKKIDLEQFKLLYFDNLEKKINTPVEKKRAIKGSKNIFNTPLNFASLNIFIRNNEKYNVLYASDGIGHTSLMCEGEIDADSQSNTLSTFSSFPKNNTVTSWDDMHDGTQYEPIGLWCGTASGCEKKVTIYKVMGVHFVEKRIKIESYEPNAPKEVVVMEPVYTEPTEEQYKAVGAKIQSYIASPVPYVPSDDGKLIVYAYDFIKYKTSDYYSYCSQIVWKCWKVNGQEFDMDSDLPWISPSDIASSYNTVKIETYKN